MSFGTQHVQEGSDPPAPFQDAVDGLGTTDVSSSSAVRCAMEAMAAVEGFEISRSTRSSSSEGLRIGGQAMSRDAGTSSRSQANQQGTGSSTEATVSKTALGAASRLMPEYSEPADTFGSSASGSYPAARSPSLRLELSHFPSSSRQTKTLAPAVASAAAAGNDDREAIHVEGAVSYVNQEQPELLELPRRRYSASTAREKGKMRERDVSPDNDDAVPSSATAGGLENRGSAPRSQTSLLSTSSSGSWQRNRCTRDRALLRDNSVGSSNTFGEGTRSVPPPGPLAFPLHSVPSTSDNETHECVSFPKRNPFAPLQVQDQFSPIPLERMGKHNSLSPPSSTARSHQASQLSMCTMESAVAPNRDTNNAGSLTAADVMVHRASGSVSRSGSTGSVGKRSRKASTAMVANRRSDSAGSRGFATNPVPLSGGSSSGSAHLSTSKSGLSARRARAQSVPHILTSGPVPAIRTNLKRPSVDAAGNVRVASSSFSSRARLASHKAPPVVRSTSAASRIEERGRAALSTSLASQSSERTPRPHSWGPQRTIDVPVRRASLHREPSSAPHLADKTGRRSGTPQALVVNGAPARHSLGHLESSNPTDQNSALLSMWAPGTNSVSAFPADGLVELTQGQDELRQSFQSRGASLSTVYAQHQRARTHQLLTALSKLQPRFPDEQEFASSGVKLSSKTPLTILTRIHQRLLFLLTNLHVFTTLFFDFNVMFVLVQLALQPDNRAADNGSIATAWWVATGVYSFFTLSWFLGVVLLHDYVLCFQRVFSEANAYILSIYLSSTAYTLCSLKSYSHYSFLHRIRWSATSTDFFIETCWYYSQNWPTIITLIPRAIICIIVLVLYNPSGTLSSTLSSTPGLMSARDPFFFDSATDLLSTYASIVLVVYLGWVSWRALVLVVSYFGLLFTMGFSGLRHAKLNVILPQNVVNFGSSRRFSSSVPLTRPSDVTSWLDKEPGSEMMIHFTHADGQPIFMQRAEDRIRELLFEYAPHRFSAAADQGFSRSFGRSMEQARPRSYAEELPMGSYQSSRPGPHGPASGSKFYQATIGLGTVDEGSKSKHNVPADDSADRAPSEEERRIPSHATPMFSMGRPVAAAEKLSSDNARPVGEREGGKGPPNLVPFPFLSLRNNDVGSPIRISNDGSLPRSSISRDGALPMPSAFNDVVPAVPRALCRRESASSSLSTASTTRGTSSSIYYQPEEMMLQPSQSDEHIEDRTAETQSPLSPTGQREESTDPITPHRSWPILHQKLDFVSRKPEASTWWAFLPGLRANPASRVDKSQLQKTETMHSQTDQTDAERPNSIEIVFTGEESATDPSVQPAAPAQEHHDVPVVPPSPSQTMETSESDDSAELRLWQSFPEQSRINPPGLVALRLEQHSFEEAEWKKDKAREMDAERAVAQLQNLAAAITPKLAATSSQDLSKSPSEGGLIPIKEESWGSSLNSAIASHDGHERPGEEVSVSIPQNIDIPM